jgi:hypothetical protein
MEILHVPTTPVTPGLVDCTHLAKRKELSTHVFNRLTLLYWARIDWHINLVEDQGVAIGIP